MANKTKTKKRSKKISKKVLCKNIKSVVFALNTFVAFLVFFNLIVLLSGGWDDMSVVEVVSLPVLGIVALVLAMLNVYKHESTGSELVSSIIVFALSTFAVFGYFFYPVLIPVFYGEA